MGSPTHSIAIFRVLVEIAVSIDASIEKFFMAFHWYFNEKNVCTLRNDYHRVVTTRTVLLSEWGVPILEEFFTGKRNTLQESTIE